MADIALPDRAERAFRIDAALRGAAIAVARNVPLFCIASGIAALPGLLLSNDATVTATEWTWAAVSVVISLASGEAPRALLGSAAGVALGMVLGALSQAIVIQGTLAHMRGRPVNVMAALRMALRVFFPVIGAEICVALLGGIGFFLLIIPGFVLLTMFYVATPVCVVEQAGPWTSLRRSATLVSGNGWKIAGMVILVAVLDAVGTGLAQALGPSAGASIGLIANLSWGVLDSAFSAALLAATYHDLRVAKEGVDTDQIARVFD
jgi:hypothetical protein